ncbi:hypothetical protein QVD99_001202 [Batrachochytrium dendrobatidis]|nr:hypothetical protein O5D80_001003 [Batrachochytrium dendrobatidis]KAK5672439.1 hypothetical protein QVD99_001202 [Batrachochytrium dendrobatidis]
MLVCRILPFLACLSWVYAWETEDHEIFDLQDALVGIEPKGDFYSILEIPRSAELAEINRAYRKKSLAFHPDKTKDPKLRKLHTILTSISTILKDSDLRIRYDEHLARGFPTWRGTGYYYSRYKPGIFVAIFAILFFISVAQYIIAWIFYYREKKEINDYMNTLNELTLVQLKKHFQKLAKKSKTDANSESTTTIPTINKHSLKNSTPLELLIASGEVDKSEFVAHKPLLTNVALVQVPLGIFTWLKNLPQAMQKSKGSVDSASSGKSAVKSASGKSSARNSIVEQARRKRRTKGNSANKNEYDDYEVNDDSDTSIVWNNKSK